MVLTVLSALWVSLLVPTSSAAGLPTDHVHASKRRGHDVHSRIPEAIQDRSRHQVDREDPHVVHGEHRQEYEKLRRKIDDHHEQGAAAWTGRIPDHLIHHFTRDGDL